MRLQTFIAPSMSEAMNAVRRALGPDAIILSSRVSDAGNVEIKAAVEHAALPTGSANAPKATEAGYRPLDLPAVENLPTPANSSIYELLLATGASATDAERWSRFIPEGRGGSSLQALTAAAEAELSFAPLPVVPDRPVALVGLPGAGRTSVAAKLAARCLQGGGVPILFSLDVHRAGGAATLQAMADRIGCALVEIANPARLEREVEEALHSGRTPIIDMPATDGLDPGAALGTLASIQKLGIEPIFVAAADSHPEDVVEVALSFLEAGVRRVLITRLDLTRRPSGLFVALGKLGLPLTQLSESPYIGSGLGPATPVRIARRILECQPQVRANASNTRSERSAA